MNPLELGLGHLPQVKAQTEIGFLRRGKSLFLAWLIGLQLWRSGVGRVFSVQSL